jgi:hypothetical protein
MIDFKESLDFKIHYESNCNSSCEILNYCNCRIPIGLSIFDYNIDYMISDILEYILGVNKKRSIKLYSILKGVNVKLLKYAIDRVLVKSNIFDLEEWDYKVIKGYYEHVVAKLVLVREKDILNNIKYIFGAKNEKEFIFRLLEFEYGYVLEDFKNKKITYKKVDKKDIIYNDDILEESINEYYDYYYLYSGVLLKSNDKWILQDGYHRLSSGIKNEYICFE